MEQREKQRRNPEEKEKERERERKTSPAGLRQANVRATSAISKATHA